MSAQPPILFLHGAFSGPEIWTALVAPWFAARGHRVAVPSLPGASGRARLRDYVARAVDAAGELGGAPVVVGHSLGGLVAQHLAARGLVRGAVLAASPGPGGLAPSLWHLSSRYPDVLATTLMAQAGAGPAMGLDLVRRALFTEETSDDWIRGVMTRPMRAESPQALFDAMTWDLPAWPFARATPMLAVMGDRDAFVPVTDLWSIAMTYGAETELMRGMAHGLPVDPSWKSLAWRINAWLDERGLAERRIPARGAAAGAARS